MRIYNQQDILALEDVYDILIPWDGAVNFSLYNDELENVCSCGSIDFKRNGFFYGATGRHQRFSCRKCGKEMRSRKNMLDKEKIKALRIGTKR